MIHIKISHWVEDGEWSTTPPWANQHKKQFVNRAREYTSMSNTELKRLSRRVFDKETYIIELDKAVTELEATGVCHVLETMGAKFEVSKT